METWAAKRDVENKRVRAVLLAQLRILGITEVSAEYEGYGESGALPSCLCLREAVEVWHADPVFHAAPEGLSFST